MPTLDAALFERYVNLIYRHSGIRLAARTSSSLGTRIQRRLAATGISDADAYLAHISKPSATLERQELIDLITIGETSFYRTPSHFQWFADDFVPELIAKQKRGQHDRTLRIWSAACANGAEAYTIALVLAAQSLRLKDWTIKILGTDLSAAAITAARAGQYNRRLIDHVPQATAARAFKPIEARNDWVQLADKYRDMVRFETHNLIQPPRGGAFAGMLPLDCIFLRNVLIYFDEPSKLTALSHAAAALAPGGYLIVGPSEGIYGLKHGLEKINPTTFRNS